MYGKFPYIDHTIKPNVGNITYMDDMEHGVSLAQFQYGVPSKLGAPLPSIFTPVYMSHWSFCF